MKKLFTVVCLMVALMLASINLNAQTEQSAQPSYQTPYSVSVHGGYSWLNGVVGGEFQYGHFAVGGGWMPNKYPLSGNKISSGCFAGTYYTGTPLDETTFSGGVSTAGYLEEDSYGNQFAMPTYIVMAGSKYNAGGVYLKGGVGYGWCEYLGSFTFELTLGLTLFGN